MKAWFSFLAIQLPWQQFKTRNLYKIYMLDRGLLNKHFWKSSHLLLPFSIFPIMSMENLSCHSNQSIWATATNNTVFVEANAINNSVKFQVNPIYSFWGVYFFFNIFHKFSLSVAKATSQIEWFGLKWHVWRRTTPQPFLLNFCQNICNEVVINANFQFSHNKPMEILSCHSNESTWSTAIKKTHNVCRG